MSTADPHADRAGSSTEPLEIEVKLAVSRPRRIARLLRHPDPGGLAGFLPVGAATSRTIVDRYLDTDQEGGKLAQAWMRARLRRHGSHVTLAVKRASQERDGVTERVELQSPATTSLDADRWPPSAARTALLQATGVGKLQEVARLRQHRVVRVVRRGPTSVELSLDRVDAMVGDRLLDRRYELEAELLEGARGDLAELADALRQLDGIEPAVGSKLAFALEARGHATPRGLAEG